MVSFGAIITQDRSLLGKETGRNSENESWCGAGPLMPQDHRGTHLRMREGEGGYVYSVLMQHLLRFISFGI